MKNKILFLALLFCIIIDGFDLKSQTYPTGFSQTNVVTGIGVPTAMAIAPDGRFFICQQNGLVRILKNGVLSNLLTIDVDFIGERGLIGIAIDPNFTINNYIYLYHTTAGANRISRFTLSGDNVVPASKLEILRLENLSSATNHNGGGLAFGPDGKLYIGVGDNATSSNSQNPNNRLGKVLRINADGTIPVDNPANIDGIGMPTGVNRAIWCAGLRNPYTLAFQPGTGILFVNDVGQGAWEEVNDCTLPGKNFGWPATEGNFNQASFPNFTLPAYAYPHGGLVGQGFAITGGTFFNPTSTNYPSQYIGKYFFMDYSVNWIDMLSFSAPTLKLKTENAKLKEANIWTREPFASSISGSSVGLTTGPDGNLYYLSRSTGALVSIVNNTALPIKLAYFKVQIIQNRAIELSWQTHSEINAQNFIIQRSTDHKRWEEIGQLDAMGNSTESKTYKFVDSEPANGINYYRLKLIDIDRKDDYSKIVSQFFEKNELKIFPNPAKNIIEIESIQLDSTLELISETGQNLADKVTISQNRLNISQLPVGKYFIKIKGKSMTFIKN